MDRRTLPGDGVVLTEAVRNERPHCDAFGKEQYRGSTFGEVSRRGFDALSNLSVGVKINLLLLLLGLAPPLSALILLHHAGGDFLQNALALYVAAFLLFLYPLARTMQELIVLRQARRINDYVEEVKAGRPTPQFNLPGEKGDEHDFLRLQRNIFWMVQGLKNREARLQDALRELKNAQRQVLESVEYASRIQRSFLPSGKDLQSALGEHFLIWLPRDGVGGDAYWVKRTQDHTYLAVFDCTGHGVPGAFLSLIVNSLFEQILDDLCCNNPARLLVKMNKGLKNALSQHDEGMLSDDGLEGAICCIDRKKHILHFAGARSFLFLAEGNGMREIRGDRIGIGFVDVPLNQEFTNHAISLQGIHAAYLFTDGVTDQIGGKKRLPFGRSRLKRCLEAHSLSSMANQQLAVERAFDEYKGGNAQRDDVTVLGLSIKD